MLTNPLIHSLIMPTDEEQPLIACQLLSYFLTEEPPLWAEENNGDLFPSLYIIYRLE
jgi:hypothetical protein